MSTQSTPSAHTPRSLDERGDEPIAVPAQTWDGVSPYLLPAYRTWATWLARRYDQMCCVAADFQRGVGPRLQLLLTARKLRQ